MIPRALRRTLGIEVSVEIGYVDKVNLNVKDLSLSYLTWHSGARLIRWATTRCACKPRRHLNQRHHTMRFKATIRNIHTFTSEYNRLQTPGNY